MIKAAEKTDLPSLAALACLLWEHHTQTEMEAEFAEEISGGDAQFFLKLVDNVPVGFAQCQLRRDYVEGTDSSPVGYLEGIFVRKEFRGHGFARELLRACESWAAEQGCTEFASDCEITNLESFQFHMHCGFLEANRIICFTKRLGEQP